MTTRDGQEPMSYRDEACTGCGQQMVVYMTGECLNCFAVVPSEADRWEILVQGISGHQKGEHDYFDKDSYDCTLCHLAVDLFREAVAWTERVRWHEERYWLRWALHDIAGERWVSGNTDSGADHRTIAGSIARVALTHSDERKADAERSRGA